MGSIHFFEERPTPWFRERRKMKTILTELFGMEKTPMEQVQVILVSDEELLKVNQNFLQHDDYTDIITFDLSVPGGPKISDIYISVERVEENAKTWNTTRLNELRRVMIHGCLHLCGYKDKLKKDQAEMRAREDFYLRLYAKRST